MFLPRLGTGKHASGDGIAEAVDFDGTYDYLSRSSDLVGNVYSATFTFSCWFYYDYSEHYMPLFYAKNTSTNAYMEFRINCDYNSSQSLDCRIYNGVSNDSAFYNSDSSFGAALNNTWNHLLISFNNSYLITKVYLNDINILLEQWGNSGSSRIFNNYWVNYSFAVTQSGKGRLSHLFLDYTYRDLSIEANRRLFITSDLKPAANQAALNPIVYLPMTDPSTAHINEGTGGNFVLNGTVARSGRGPNQFNAPYSDLNGSADYLSRTSITGIADSKTFTFACCFNSDDPSSDEWLIGFANGTAYIFRIFFSNSSSRLYIEAKATDTTDAISAYISFNPIGNRNYILQISCDMTNSSNRWIMINGLSQSVTWTTCADKTIDFLISGSPKYNIGCDIESTPTSYFNGRLGNLFFDTRYIDLSIPANLAKFCTGTGIDCKSVSLGASGELPFGTPPLIYLPMYANNAGKNYGTGGDFTVNSGPFVGARGMNEYWGNKADFDGSTGYLSRTSALTGVSDGNTFSGSFFVQLDTTGADQSIFAILPSVNDTTLTIKLNNANYLQIAARTSALTTLINGTVNTTTLSTSLVSVQFCITLTANTSNRYIYINGVQQTVTWDRNLTGVAQLSAPLQRIGRQRDNNNYPLNGKLSEFYFTTDYIDFSQESNRLKFRDAFGSPVALLPQIEAGTIPTPAIYMRFDPNNLGKNDGTGGDFITNGTILDGGQL